MSGRRKRRVVTPPCLHDGPVADHTRQRQLDDDRRCLAAVHDDLGALLATPALTGAEIAEGVRLVRDAVRAHLRAVDVVGSASN